MFSKKYSNEYFNIKTYINNIDKDNDDNIISASGSEFIDNLVKDKNIEFGTSLVKYIEKYFKDNGGSC